MTDLMRLPPSVIANARARAKIRGHAAPPGAGPEGETCKTCAHIVRVEYAKVYLKCGLSRARWTGGGGTDIRAGDPACSRWEKA